MSEALRKEIERWEKALRIGLERLRRREAMVRSSQDGLEAEEVRRREEDIQRIVNRLEELERLAGIEHVRRRRSEWRWVDWCSMLVKLWAKGDYENAISKAKEIERVLGLPGLAEDVASWPRLQAYGGRGE